MRGFVFDKNRLFWYICAVVTNDRYGESVPISAVSPKETALIYTPDIPILFIT